MTEVLPWADWARSAGRVKGIYELVLAKGSDGHGLETILTVNDEDTLALAASTLLLHEASDSSEAINDGRVEEGAEEATLVETDRVGVGINITEEANHVRGVSGSCSRHKVQLKERSANIILGLPRPLWCRLAEADHLSCDIAATRIISGRCECTRLTIPAGTVIIVVPVTATARVGKSKYVGDLEGTTEVHAEKSTGSRGGVGILAVLDDLGEGKAIEANGGDLVRVELERLKRSAVELGGLGVGSRSSGLGGWVSCRHVRYGREWVDVVEVTKAISKAESLSLCLPVTCPSVCLSVCLSSSWLADSQF